MWAPNIKVKTEDSSFSLLQLEGGQESWKCSIPFLFFLLFCLLIFFPTNWTLVYGIVHLEGGTFTCTVECIYITLFHSLITHEPVIFSSICQTSVSLFHSVASELKVRMESVLFIRLSFPYIVRRRGYTAVPIKVMGVNQCEFSYIVGWKIYHMCS